MNYDVFISYSRKDTAIADRVCRAFDRAGISYFIDRQGIGGGFEFPRVLAENIVGARLFLLLASENAYNSKFTMNEIVFAFNKKPKQSILPYIIDGSSLPLELEFTFAGINWRNISDHPIDTVLVSDILKLLEREDVAASQNTTATKSYNVGDYYNEGGKEGVVFEVSDDGRHGKIVSLDEAEQPWCTQEQYSKNIVVGASSTTDGRANTDRVMARSDSEAYPAFVWCRAMGRDWYLPAAEELKSLYNVIDRVDDALQRRGKRIVNKYRHWSSSENTSVYYVNHVTFVNMATGVAVDYNKPYNAACVRAVAKF